MSAGPASDEFIAAGEATLRVRHRSGHGLPVFWLHEFGGTVESWSALWDLLPQAGPFVAHDLRGCGLSMKLRGRPTVQVHLDDLAFLIDRYAGSQPVALAGCALGAAVALGMAAARPGQVVGVIAMAPALGVTPEVAAALHARADRQEHAGMHEALEASMRASWPEALREPRATYEAYVARWLGNDPGSFAAGLRLIAGLDPLPWLPGVRCPVAVVAGTLDANRSPQEIERRLAGLPRVSHTVVEAGHFMTLQAPERLAPVVAAALASFEPPPDPSRP
ncbi:MAG TPA: alpha/beta hydrolase [Ramlibacter sp.]|nr:alpha/beta hydrolase [Ramlibacter sp.]